MDHVIVLLIGEGPHEIGHEEDVPLDGANLPSLAVLVRRLLGNAENARFVCRRGSSIRITHRGKMSGRFGKRVWSAVRYAGRNGFRAVVFVVDRDGLKNTGRLAELKEGRDHHGVEGLPCAVGTAIEAFDAWMIPDTGAIRAAGGDASGVHPGPESLNGKAGTGRHPKDIANAIFGTKGGTGLGPKYAIVAEHVDLELLQRACPQGFAPFAAEVRERIRPVTVES